MKRYKPARFTDPDSRTRVLTVIHEFNDKRQLLVNGGCGAVDVEDAWQENSPFLGPKRGPRVWQFPAPGTDFCGMTMNCGIVFQASH